MGSGGRRRKKRLGHCRPCSLIVILYFLMDGHTFPPPPPPPKKKKKEEEEEEEESMLSPYLLSDLHSESHSSNSQVRTGIRSADFNRLWVWRRKEKKEKRKKKEEEESFAFSIIC